MSDRTVSILLPTYEPNPAFLRIAIESVLRQSHTHWTLFIHDDASRAAVEEMIRPYLQDKRIQFERGQRRQGIGGNWNACLRRAHGDAIQFLFQDDEWSWDFLESALTVLEQEPTVGLVVADHAYRAESPLAQAYFDRADYTALRENRRTSLRDEKGNGQVFLTKWLQQGLHPNIVGEPSFVLLRRSVVERAGLFREDMYQGLDAEYWTRMLLRSDLRFIDRELGVFRVHTAGASMRNDETGRGLFDRLRCIELLLRTLPAGDMRSAAEHAVVSQLAGMMKKYKKRVGDGGRVGSGKIRTLLFLLRHPVLTARSLRTLVPS